MLRRVCRWVFITMVTATVVSAALILLFVWLMRGYDPYEPGCDAHARCYNGSLPLEERVSIDAAYADLMERFTAVGVRIDAEFGPQEWVDGDGPPDVFTECTRHQGFRDERVVGTARGVTKESSERIVTIVEEEFASSGFAFVGAHTNKSGTYVHMFNREHGGVVSVQVTDQGTTMSYATGCRPGSAVPPTLGPLI